MDAFVVFWGEICVCFITLLCHLDQFLVVVFTNQQGRQPQEEASAERGSSDSLGL